MVVRVDQRAVDVEDRPHPRRLPDGGRGHVPCDAVRRPDRRARVPDVAARAGLAGGRQLPRPRHDRPRGGADVLRDAVALPRAPGRRLAARARRARPRWRTDAANYVAENGADPATAEVIKQSLDTLFESSGSGVGVALALSLILGLNGASGAFGAAGRALNVIHAVDEDRGFVPHKLADVGWTLVVILLFAVVLVALFLGGGIADDLFGPHRAGRHRRGRLVRSRAGPSRCSSRSSASRSSTPSRPTSQPRRLRWLSPGAVVAVRSGSSRRSASRSTSADFSSYGAAYGAFGAAIVLLLWLYITANAFLFGAELNVAIAGTAGRAGRAAVRLAAADARAPGAGRARGPSRPTGGLGQPARSARSGASRGSPRPGQPAQSRRAGAP